MTPEQLDEIEKLAVNFKSAAFHDLMSRQTMPLVKALREARALVVALKEEHRPADEIRSQLLTEIEAHAETKAEVERLVSEAKEARAACFRLESERNQAVKDRDASYDAIESARATTQRVRDVAMRKRNESKAEVERLREAVRKVHALAERGRDFAASEAVREIHKITNGMVE